MENQLQYIEDNKLAIDIKNKDGYESKILQTENINNIIKPKLILNTENDKYEFHYDIKDKLSLDMYMKENRLNVKDFENIIGSINNIYKEADKLLISNNSIVIKPEFMYIDLNNNNNIEFMAVPDMEQDYTFELSKLLIRLLRFVDHNDKDTLQLAYKLFVKSSKDDYTLNDLLDCFENKEIFNNNDNENISLTEQWLKEYINMNILQYDNDNEIVKNLNEKEYKKLENKVFSRLKNDENFWNDIDNHVSNSIDSVIEEYKLETKDIKDKFKNNETIKSQNTNNKEKDERE